MLHTKLYVQDTIHRDRSTVERKLTKLQLQTSFLRQDIQHITNDL